MKRSLKTIIQISFLHHTITLSMMQICNSFHVEVKTLTEDGVERFIEAPTWITGKSLMHSKNLPFNFKVFRTLLLWNETYLNLTRFRYLFEDLIKCNLAVRVKGSVEPASYASRERPINETIHKTPIYLIWKKTKGLQGADIFSPNIIRWIKS